MSKEKQLPNMEELDDEQLDRAAGGFFFLMEMGTAYCRNCQKETSHFFDARGVGICKECGK